MAAVRSSSTSAVRWSVTRERTAVSSKSLRAGSNDSSPSRIDAVASSHTTLRTRPTDTSAQIPTLVVDGGSANESDSANDTVSDVAHDSAAGDAVDDDDTSEFEDVDKLAFRDLPFADASDSEYAPSHHSSSDNSDHSDSDDSDSDSGDAADEPSTAAALFANVQRRWRSNTRRAATDFSDADRAFWPSPDAKQQWIDRLRVADEQHVRAFGCRLDAPANAAAVAQLRREQRRRQWFVVALSALCVAYLIQLVVLYTARPTASSDTSVSTRLMDAPTSDWLDPMPAMNASHAALDDAAPKQQHDTSAATALDAARVALDAIDVLIEPVVIAVNDHVVGAQSDAVEANDAAINTTDESANNNVAAAVAQCRLQFRRVVASPATAAIHTDALHACDAAVVQTQTHLSDELPRGLAIEALVLRADLLSVAVAYDAAAVDYAAAMALLSETTTALLDALKLKATANRYVALFHQRAFRELRRAARTTANDTTASVALQALAREWRMALKQQTQLTDVLTATRVWTFQQLVFDSVQ